MTSSTRMWRARTGSIVAAALGGLSLSLIIGLDSAFVQDAGFTDLAIMLSLSMAVVWVFAYRPSISIERDELIIRNPFRTRRLPLGEATDVQPTYVGLRFPQRDGCHAVGWAVQKSNVAQWLGRETRADRIAAEIRRHLPNATPAATAPR